LAAAQRACPSCPSDAGSVIPGKSTVRQMALQGEADGLRQRCLGLNIALPIVIELFRPGQAAGPEINQAQ